MGCFLPPPCPHHAATAPASAVVELGVVRRCYASLVNRTLYVLLVLGTSLSLGSCADLYRRNIFTDTRQPERVRARLRSGIIPDPPPNRWHCGNTEYFDHNGDGRIDEEVVSIEGYWGSDGYGRFKIDTDYDGFYDKECEMGGVAGELRWSRPIHEAVPSIHRGMIPGPLR